MADVESHLKVKIAHVLAVDVVEYSTLLITEQSRVMGDLTRLIRATPSLESTYAAAGFDAARHAVAQKTAQGEYIPAHAYLEAYMRLGDREQACAWLAKAFEERNRIAFQIRINPLYDPLRSDPRFDKLGERVLQPQMK